ncbi:hypothetical protein AAHA92_04671 [Salvia divinorum]|uniref:Uncharacterized protein n=1 Tax=Salvia divinorum TaxID=28513 RepID=A0ABD1I006_SALDI
MGENDKEPIMNHFFCGIFLHRLLRFCNSFHFRTEASKILANTRKRAPKTRENSICAAMIIICSIDASL